MLRKKFDFHKRSSAPLSRHTLTEDFSHFRERTTKTTKTTQTTRTAIAARTARTIRAATATSSTTTSTTPTTTTTSWRNWILDEFIQLGNVLPLLTR
ncbi:hypothetical protein FHG87_019559 [Trinorchestia longiramus]|nr:hypothetical protein FHG87_019559 [Trinorchestia longiramus]